MRGKKRDLSNHNWRKQESERYSFLSVGHPCASWAQIAWQSNCSEQSSYKWQCKSRGYLYSCIHLHATYNYIFDNSSSLSLLNGFSAIITVVSLRNRFSESQAQERERERKRKQQTDAQMREISRECWRILTRSQQRLDDFLWAICMIDMTHIKSHISAFFSAFMCATHGDIKEPDIQWYGYSIPSPTAVSHN